MKLPCESGLVPCSVRFPVFILLLSFLALSLSTSVPLAYAALGTITEYPVPTASSEPIGITGGPDGNLWFTEFSGNKIGRITPTAPNTITEFPIPTANSDPRGIASGRGDKVWIAESMGNKIGRIDTK